jgi:hypothetical protein
VARKIQLKWLASTKSTKVPKAICGWTTRAQSAAFARLLMWPGHIQRAMSAPRRDRLIRLEHRLSPRHCYGDLRTCIDVHQSHLPAKGRTSFNCRYRTSFTCRLTRRSRFKQSGCRPSSADNLYRLWRQPLKSRITNCFREVKPSILEQLVRKTCSITEPIF